MSSNFGLDANAYSMWDRRRNYHSYSTHGQPSTYAAPPPLSFDLPTTTSDSLRYHTAYPTTSNAETYPSYSYHHNSQPVTPLTSTTPISYHPPRFDGGDYYSNLLHNPVLPRPNITLPTTLGSTLPLFSQTASAHQSAVSSPSTNLPVQPPTSPKIPEVEPCTKNYGSSTKDPNLSVWGDPCESAPPLQAGGKRRVYCWYCDKIFDDRKWVQRHAENHFYPAWECNLCHNRAHRPDVLERHCKVTCLKSHNRQGEDPKEHVKKTSPLARERAESWRKQNGKEPLRASKKARVTGPCDSPVPLFAPGYASAGSNTTSPSVVSLSSSRSNSFQGP